MKLPPEGARWLVSLRWLACAAVFGMTWLTSSVLHVVANPLPLYLVACAMAGLQPALQADTSAIRPRAKETSSGISFCKSPSI